MTPDTRDVLVFLATLLVIAGVAYTVLARATDVKRAITRWWRRRQPYQSRHFWN